MRLLIQKGVDGVLLVPSLKGEVAIELARSNDVNIVILDRRSANRQVDIVRCDSETGAYEIGKHLAVLGHDRFAILAGEIGMSTSEDRISGFLRAIRDAGRNGKTQVLHARHSVADGAGDDWRGAPNGGARGH